jgi:hypothetical protein
MTGMPLLKRGHGGGGHTAFSESQHNNQASDGWRNLGHIAEGIFENAGAHPHLCHAGHAI